MINFGAEGDLSQLDYDVFLREMERVFREVHRVLIPDRVFAVMTGNVCRTMEGSGNFFAVHSAYIQMAQRMGLRLWNIVLWEFRVRTDRNAVMGSFPFPHKIRGQFGHAYILVFRKA